MAMRYENERLPTAEAPPSAAGKESKAAVAGAIGATFALGGVLILIGGGLAYMGFLATQAVGQRGRIALSPLIVLLLGIGLIIFGIFCFVGMAKYLASSKTTKKTKSASHFR